MSFDDFEENLCLPLPCPGCGGNGATFVNRLAVGPVRLVGLSRGRADTVTTPARCAECHGRGHMHWRRVA